MDWKGEVVMALNVLYAAILGGVIGWERETEGRDAGVRTFAAVSLGSCVFAEISAHLTGDVSPHVIAAGVVSGVGFIGAGVIMQDRGNIIGLTTAATLWATSAIGLAIGYELYVLGSAVAVLVFALLSLQRLPWWDRVTNATRRKKTS
jgi:putative Mg2+ transporter-C (MgtC) family protein